MTLRAGLVLSILLLALGIAAPAHADVDPTLQQFAAGTVSRARRAVAIGPMVGAGVAYAPEPGELDVPLTFGIGAAFFKVEVLPSPAQLQEMIVARTKAKVQARIEGMILRGESPPEGAELEQLAREVVEEVKAEILGYHRVRGRKLERPRLTIALEGAYLPRAGAGHVRATIGIGIKIVTIGPSFAVDFAGANGLFVGGELAVHLTPKQGPRPPVIDLFLRYDFGATSGTEGADQLGLGFRLLLDLL